MANGVIVWEGASQIDGAPIVLIATGLARGSANGKTGADLIQTWVLRADVSPLDAVNSGADQSICGNCPHRGQIVDGRNVGRSCYVTVFQAPRSIFAAYQRGAYDRVTPEQFATRRGARGVRLGSYGDPAAVPFDVWAAMLEGAPFHTGYTHQWRTADMRFARFVMASCDAPCDRVAAKILGYRTFRVRALTDEIEAREIVCPASEEAGFKTSCDKCRACGGLSAKARADVVIAVHGAPSKVAAYQARA